jgi:hypothetical protein
MNDSEAHRGESISWEKEALVPLLPAGTMKLVASVYLVDSGACDTYGCYGVLLSAQTFPLKVVAGRSAISLPKHGRVCVEAAEDRCRTGHPGRHAAGLELNRLAPFWRRLINEVPYELQGKLD